LAFEADKTKRLSSATPLRSAGLFALSVDDMPLKDSRSLSPGIEVCKHSKRRHDSANWIGANCIGADWMSMTSLRVVAQTLSRFLPVQAG
jgi:hypothetical protein